ncbi:N-acetylmuramoyl-L-alanine amidase sle1 [Lachnospiraceae bacterium]|nr:N-acetylmuramoyl-L-alanine amidase sle1 [Lachnospiraceae bacterium]
MKEELKREIAAEAAKIIFANEGNYSSVNADDNGALSVGKVQWHGNRALSLLKKIVQGMGAGAETVLGGTLYREIMTASDWAGRKATAEEKVKLSKVLGSVQGKQVQDAQAEEDILLYVTHGVKMGIEDPQSLIYFADLENQGGAGASKRVGNAAAQKAGGAGKVNLAIIHTAALADRVMGKYSSRRNLVYKKAQELFKGTAGAENKNQTGGKKTMTEQELRNKVVQTARGYLGSKEADGTNKKIIDGYNAHKPLARGYLVKYTDAWCATFVSFIGIVCGLTDIMPTECGCGAMIDLYKKKGCWQENDAHRPQPADIIMYDWDDNGVGDCTGYPEHVGIVKEVNGNTITVIEGNMNDAVGERTLQVNGRFIRGYCLPDYASKASGVPSASVPSGNPSSGSASSAEQVYTVRAGDTLSKIAEKYGTTYQKLASYNGIANPNKINVGQKIKIPGSGVKTYTVKPGDSLWAIAAAQLGDGSRYNEIKVMNGLTSNTIHAGQTLKLPEA